MQGCNGPSTVHFAALHECSGTALRLLRAQGPPSNPRDQLGCFEQLSKRCLPIAAEKYAAIFLPSFFRP